MVALVENNKTKARAQMLHVNVRRIVGRDGDGMDTVLTATQHADRTTKYCRQACVPLPNQIQRWCNDEGASAFVVDGQDRQFGFAGARWQYHDAPTGASPGRKRLGLIGPRFTVNARARR